MRGDDTLKSLNKEGRAHNTSSIEHSLLDHFE